MGLSLGLGLDLAAGRPAAGPSFDPASVSGLLLGAYAEAGTYQDAAGTTPAVADADPVGNWADTLSAEGNDLLQSTAGKRPILKLNQINSLPAIRFDGDVDFLQSLFTLAGPYTVVLAYKSVVVGAAVNNHDFILDGGDDTGGAVLCAATPVTYLGPGDYPNAAQTICDGVYGLVTAVFNGASSKLRLNGAQVVSGDTGTIPAAGGITLASERNGNTARTSQIDVAAVLVYSGALSAGDVDYLEAGLDEKYGGAFL